MFYDAVLVVFLLILRLVLSMPIYGDHFTAVCLDKDWAVIYVTFYFFELFAYMYVAVRDS